MWICFCSFPSIFILTHSHLFILGLTRGSELASSRIFQPVWGPAGGGGWGEVCTLTTLSKATSPLRLPPGPFISCTSRPDGPLGVTN